MAKTLQVNESIVIDKPLPEVFAYLTDPANAAEWGSNIVDYKVLSGSPDEVGAVMSVTAKVAGARIDATEKVTAYEKDKRMGFESADSKIAYTREIGFSSDGDGATKVTYVQDAEEGSGLFKFADAIVLKLYAHDVRGNLQKAKVILETPNG
ncbi:SRPBCC family protein [Rhodococcus hoagii]|nr:SRPBCC family protein [Prescottella equi]